MEAIHIISKFPEHPVLTWKDTLYKAVPLGDSWWYRFYKYLLLNAEHPNEIGYTLARTFDLIAKDNAPELLVDMPSSLPGTGDYIKDSLILDGILKYRTKLGHIMNRNLPIQHKFKMWHWDLFMQYCDSTNDSATKILLWAWSKSFWTPCEPDAFYDSPYRCFVAALILKNIHDPYKKLFDDIKLYWTSNNKQLPRQTDFYSKDIEVKTAAWFFWLCPEYSDMYSLFEHQAQTLSVFELYQLLLHGYSDSEEVGLELPELKVNFI